MAKKYSGGIVTATGFKLDNPNPISDYMVVEFLTDLNTIPNQFIGMETFVLEDDSLWVKKSTGWSKSGPTKTSELTNDGFDGESTYITFEDLDLSTDRITKSTGFIQSGMTLTLYSGWTWTISQENYTNPSNVIINIPLASSGNTRIDLIVATTGNTFTRIAGTEDTTNPVAPTAPINTIEATIVFVTDELITPEPPIDGGEFQKKIEKQDILNSSGPNNTVVIQGLTGERSSVRYTNGVNGVRTLAISNQANVYSGKKLIIKNSQTNLNRDIILYHLSSTGAGGYKFSFPNELDFILKPRHIAEFSLKILTSTTGVYEYIGELPFDSSSLNLKEVLDNGNVAEFDDGNSFVSLLDGAENDRTINLAVWNGESGLDQQDSNLYLANSQANLQNTYGNANSSFSVIEGVPQIRRQLSAYPAGGIAETFIKIMEPISGSFSNINFPAPAVSGDYTVALTSDIATPDLQQVCNVGSEAIDLQYVFVVRGDNVDIKGQISVGSDGVRLQGQAGGVFIDGHTDGIVLTGGAKIDYNSSAGYIQAYNQEVFKLNLKNEIAEQTGVGILEMNVDGNPYDGIFHLSGNLKIQGDGNLSLLGYAGSNLDLGDSIVITSGNNIIKTANNIELISSENSEIYKDLTSFDGNVMSIKFGDDGVLTNRVIDKSGTTQSYLSISESFSRLGSFTSGDTLNSNIIVTPQAIELRKSSDLYFRINESEIETNSDINIDVVSGGEKRIYNTISGNTRMLCYTDDGYLQINNSNSINGTALQAGLEESTIGATNFSLNQTSVIKVRFDDIIVESNVPDFKGLEYSSNYSSNFTNRSLVDKEYVDKKNDGGVFTFTGDDSTDSFIITHTLGSEPKMHYVTRNSDSSGNLFETNITPGNITQINVRFIAGAPMMGEIIKLNWGVFD